MFTTLKITIRPRKSLLERLHLVKKRKFITTEHKLLDTTFYTTVLISYCQDNSSALRTFRRRADMPVITEKSECYKKMEYIAYANTAFLLYPLTASVGIYDPNGELPFLLPYLACKSNSITVFTRREGEYTAAAQEMYKDYGTPVIFVPNAGLLKKADILFTAAALPFHFNNPSFGNKNISDFKPTLPFSVPTLQPDADILAVSAGLYFVENIKTAKNVFFSK